MALDNAAVLDRLQDRFGNVVLESSEFRGTLAVQIQPDALPEIATFLRADPELQYIMLTAVTGVDYL
ncbi:MAG: NADH-quinone oxidoreductase subunit, partial [Actinomycetota bacterium]|nr:NADH-quinone oxidoreductase subunit [Actinomycetota bacterium]